MGICWCKQKNEESDTYIPPQSPNSLQVHNIIQPVSPVSTQYSFRLSKIPDASYVDKLVLETLGVIATLVDK